MKRVSLQPAYVLHRRSYRETSFLLELFSLDYGRVAVVAKGVRRAKSPLPGLLQPFIPLLVSWSGRGELLSLTQVEAHGEIKILRGNCLFAGFYLNELLMHLLQKWDEHHVLYQAYEKTLQELQTNVLAEKTLRSFEKKLLEELGYGLLSKSTTALEQNFSPNSYYRFVPEYGFEPCAVSEASHLLANVFSGKNLLAIAAEDWHESSLYEAKRLMRYVLATLLGTRALHSRRLFI